MIKHWLVAYRVSIMVECPKCGKEGRLCRLACRSVRDAINGGITTKFDYTVHHHEDGKFKKSCTFTAGVHPAYTELDEIYKTLRVKESAKQRIIDYLLSPETQGKSIDTHVFAEELRLDYQMALDVLNELHEKGLISRDR